MGTNSYNEFAELVEHYVAAARSSAEASTSSEPFSYPHYDPEEQRRYYEGHYQPYHCNQAGVMMNQDQYGYNLPFQENRQPFNEHHYAGPATSSYHLTSAHENPNRIPYDRKRERSMGYSQARRAREPQNSGYSKVSPPNASTKSRVPTAKPQDHNIIICDICKVSCAGELPYKEHLEGKQHKKKEKTLSLASQEKQANMVTNKATSTNATKPTTAADNAATTATSSTASLFIRCNVCDITCCGKESYESHLRGSKHKKVVDLSKKLEKPSQDIEDARNPSSSDQNRPSIKVLGAPIINFVKGGRLHTIDNMVVELPEEGEAISESTEDDDPPSQSIDDPDLKEKGDPPHPSSTLENTETLKECQDEFSKQNGSSTPCSIIGEEYVKEMTSDDKIIGYHCTLCDCQFNSVTAKLDHLKGKRHRSNHKLKNATPNSNQNTAKRKATKTKKSKRQKIQQDSTNSSSQTTQADPNLLEMPYQAGTQIVPPSMSQESQPVMPPPPPTSLTSQDETLLDMLRLIKIPEEELEDIHHVVSTVERALKLISDKMSDLQSGDSDIAKPTENPKINLLKGVIRVGILSKDLIVANDKRVDLILMCKYWPTEYLLHQISDDLPDRLKMVAPDDIYHILAMPEKASIVVTQCEGPPTDQDLSVRIALTSLKVKDSKKDLEHLDQQRDGHEDKKKPLNKTHCLRALACIRHHKWFENSLAGIDVAKMVLKLMRVLCVHSPVWGKLDLWTLEILVERTITSACEFLTIHEATRRIFEALASGILLPFGVGLVDPCEENAIEVTSRFTRQEVEDITKEAQEALRQIAYGRTKAVFPIFKYI